MFFVDYADPNFIRIVKAKKYRRACGLCCFALFLIGVFGIVIGYGIMNYQHNYLFDDYMSHNDDVAILSATYYQKSKSFPDNTVVLLLNSHQFFHNKYPELQIVSNNQMEEKVSTFRVEQVKPDFAYYCHWVPYIAVGQVVENVDSLEISNDPQSRQNGAAVSRKIKIRRPYKEKHDVVACFTPMFMNDRWQGLLVTTEVFSHYGAFMQFYVRSAITPIFKMLKTFQNARIAHWPSVKLGEQRAKGPGFDPNTELEFRNQASAMTDCLLMYKEAAQFIIFPDPIDEIIIPRLGHSYHSEFTRIFHSYPDAAVMGYNMTQTTFKSAILPQTFRPTDVLESIKFTGETRWAKLVVKPSRVDSVWIHRSYGIRKGYEQIEMPVTDNSMIHVRFNTDQEEAVNATGTAKYNPLLKDSPEELISRKDLEQIKKNFENRIKEYSETYNALPSHQIYHPLIDQCYNDGFYNGRSHSSCKGPEMCKIPAFSGVHCVNTVSKYETFTGYRELKLTGYRTLFVHILENSSFQESWNGCRL